MIVDPSIVGDFGMSGLTETGGARSIARACCPKSQPTRIGSRDWGHGARFVEPLQASSAEVYGPVA